MLILSRGVRAINFGQTLDAIYATAADKGYWPIALREMEAFTGSIGATLLFVDDKAKIASENYTGSIEPELLAFYVTEHLAHCPRHRAALTQPHRALRYDYLALDEAQMDRDPVYDWLGRQGVRYYMGTEFRLTNGVVARLSLHRSRAQGHVQRADLLKLCALRPHLRRAFNIANLRQSVRLTSRRTLPAVDGLSAATAREREVASLLLAGHSVESLSATLGISRNTTRVHLQSLFRKTGTTRQIDLVRRLLASKGQ